MFRPALVGTPTSRAIPHSGRNNHDVGTIGVVPTSEQRRITARKGARESKHSGASAGAGHAIEPAFEDSRRSRLPDAVIGFPLTLVRNYSARTARLAHASVAGRERLAGATDRFWSSVAIGWTRPDSVTSRDAVAYTEITVAEYWGGMAEGTSHGKRLEHVKQRTDDSDDSATYRSLPD